MILALKALVGALVVILIALLARTKNYYIAGLVPLFPTFTLIAHYMVGVARTHAELKTTILFSLYAVIPYGVYLLSSYFLIDRMRLELAFGCSAVLWCVTAACLLWAWNYA